MDGTDNPKPAAHLNPLHAVLLGALFPLTLGAMLSDWAYSSTYQIQWLYFADWLIAGSLVAAIPALLWALLGLLFGTGHNRLFVVLLAAAVVVNFINALTHAKDAYATMPAGLILSVIGTVMAFIASWVGFSGSRWRRAG